MKKMQKINRIILILLILGIAVFIARKLIQHRTTPKRLIHQSSGAVVEVVTVKQTCLRLQVAGTGLVQPLLEVGVAPQVSGAVVFTSSRLVQSGFFKKGEVLFKVEDTDSLLALAQAKAALSNAELDLARIEGQADIALQEWQLLNENEKKPQPLVVFTPQLVSVKAMVSSARAKVESADLDVRRTTIKAPFNCFIRSKNVDIGQYVKDGNVVLNLVGTDQAEIVVPLPLADVAMISIPDPSGKRRGSPVEVCLKVGGEAHIWKGYIDRLSGEVDSASRMLDVIVVVDDPYMLHDKTVQIMPLVMGSFVTVDIAGRRCDDVVQIPRMGLHNGSVVWLARNDSTLEVRPVTVLRKNQNDIIVSHGLENGDRVILTPLRGASSGMKLRVQSEDNL